MTGKGLVRTAKGRRYSASLENKLLLAPLGETSSRDGQDRETLGILQAWEPITEKEIQEDFTEEEFRWIKSGLKRLFEAGYIERIG